MYREITQGVQIDVKPTYSPEQSRPGEGYFFFSYTIRITNLRPVPTRLLSRHWIITDGHGQTQEVGGPGVVGEQPVIPPGATYQYSSFCPLPTPTGNMRGTYEMVDESGEPFSARIPLFFLRDLRNLH